MSFSGDERKLLQQMRSKIAQAIATNEGSLPFSDYMQLALYSPGLGYYQNGLQKFGEAGDFVTAPEMGNILARSLIASFSEQWNLLAGNERRIIEFGGGSGALASQLIALLDEKNQAPTAYWIVEPSPFLQQLQKEALQPILEKSKTKVEWLTALPEKFDGIVIANEVIDAMPCHRICKHKGKWHYLDVGLNTTTEKSSSSPADSAVETESIGFCWQPGKAIDFQLPQPLDQCDRYTEEYTTEVRNVQRGWLAMLAERLRRGLVYLVDYGYSQADYYHPQRIDGTLMSFIRHRQSSNVFIYPGLQDITAHVDFTELARNAIDVGFEMQGYSTQAGFIIDCNILPALEQEMMAMNSEQRLQLSQQIQKLMLPGQMGETIKVLALSQSADNDLIGFSANEQSHRL